MSPVNKRKKKASKNPGGRPTNYPDKSWRPGILCTEELRSIAIGKASAAGCSVSDIFERGVRELKVS